MKNNLSSTFPTDIQTIRAIALWLLLVSFLPKKVLEKLLLLNPYGLVMASMYKSVSVVNKTIENFENEIND